MFMKNKVQEAREHRGFTRYYVAKEVGIHYQTLYNIEKNTSQPGIYIAMQLASLFGCKVEDIFILT